MKENPEFMSYAYAKRAHSVQLDNYRETYGYNYQYLIPCNMYGFLIKNMSVFLLMI